MSWERHGGLRAAVAQLAAQIMYGEEVKQYFTAKRLAAKRLLGQAGGKSLRYRPRDLPSNGEIRAALLELCSEIEGDGRTRRLFAMRIAAIEAMEALGERFSPRLIGSVSTGHVRSGSDIDVHVFAEHWADVEAHCRALGWVVEVELVNILKGGKVRAYTHVRVADVFPLELTVYPPQDLRIRSRSSTDGKPIVRMRAATLRELCKREHAELWARYEADGAVPSFEDILAAEDADDKPAGVLDAIDLDDDDRPVLPGVDPWDEEWVDLDAARVDAVDDDVAADDDDVEPIDAPIARARPARREKQRRARSDQG